MRILGGFAAAFVLLFFLPVGVPRFDNAIREGLELTKWYAQEHVLLCLVPALSIAGGISVFVSQGSVMRHLGPKANKALALLLAGPALALPSMLVLRSVMGTKKTVVYVSLVIVMATTTGLLHGALF